MSHQIRISARFRKEPDYGRLARALLQFLEGEAEVEQAGADPEGHAEDGSAVSAPAAVIDSGTERQQ